MPSLNYQSLSLAEVRACLEEIARDAHTAFGRLDAQQLNWRPDESRWSVAQCLEHLITANGLMIQRAADALDDSRPRSVWQRLPVLPGVFGSLLIRSQAPANTRKFVAAPSARPSSSDVSVEIVSRFADQQRQFAERVSALDERRAARAIMRSPFIGVVSYSVLDGWRLIVAHDHRHIEQARRVMQSPGFPSPG